LVATVNDHDRRIRPHISDHGRGRVVGGFTMVVGISTFAIVTAKAAELLVRSDIAELEHELVTHANDSPTTLTGPWQELEGFESAAYYLNG